MIEIWRDIAGYEGYQVSNLGRVRSFKHKTPRILKPSLTIWGYLQVDLWRSNKSKRYTVHRLVAAAFIPNPEGKREVNHINGDKTDNRAENLEWCTPSENQRHALMAGLRQQGANHPDAKLTAAQVVYIRDNPDSLSIKQLAHMFSVTPEAISKIQCGKAYRNAGGVIRTEKISHPSRIPDDIREQIRGEYVPHKRGCGTTVLAHKYGVSQATVWNIINEN